MWRCAVSDCVALYNAHDCWGVFCVRCSTSVYVYRNDSIYLIPYVLGSAIDDAAHVPVIANQGVRLSVLDCLRSCLFANSPTPNSLVLGGQFLSSISCLLLIPTSAFPDFHTLVVVVVVVVLYQSMMLSCVPFSVAASSLLCSSAASTPTPTPTPHSAGSCAPTKAAANDEQSHHSQAKLQREKREREREKTATRGHQPTTHSATLGASSVSYQQPQHNSRDRQLHFSRRRRYWFRTTTHTISTITAIAHQLD